jgi:hypothetical protein
MILSIVNSLVEWFTMLYKKESFMSNVTNFKPLGFAQWVNKNGEALCILYDNFLAETDTCPFEVSICFG